MVGKLIIGTEVDDAGFNKGLKDIKRTAEKEKIDIDVDIESTKMDVINTKATGILSKLKTFGVGILKVIGKVLGGIATAVTIIISGIVLITALAGGIFILIKAIQKVKDSEAFKQIKTDIQYIIYALEQMLAPAIEAVANFIIKALKAIVNFIKTLIFYIAYLIRAWTGWDMFKNLDTSNFKKDMEKANKSAAGIAKSAKEINRQLAPFDEMNILQDNRGGGSSAGGGIGTPGFNFEDEWKNWNPPKWLKAIGSITPIGMGKAVASGTNTVMNGLKQVIDTAWKGMETVIKNGSRYVLDTASNTAAGTTTAVNGAGETIKNIMLSMREGIKTVFNSLYNIIAQPFVIAVGTITNLFNNLYKEISTVISGIKLAISNDLVKGIKSAIKSLGSILVAPFNSLYEKVKPIIDNIVKGIQTAIENFEKLSKKVTGVKNATGSGIKTAIKGLFGFAKGGIVYHKIPRLASGGILNQPGRGVPLGMAIGGERGAEGVIPLTDSQQMAMLGEAIGRYITVNLTNVTELDGRTIARKVQEVNNNTDFLLNR